MNRLYFLFPSLFLLISSLSFGQVPTSYTVDSTLSSVTVNGQIVGIPLDPQGPGSLTTRYSGTIDAILDNSPITTSIMLTTNSLVSAEDSGAWRPLPNGAPGAAPANYGFDAMGAIPPQIVALIPSNVIPAGVSINGINVETAIRNLELSFDNATLPVDASGMIPGTQVVARVVTGDVAVGVSVLASFGPFPLPAIPVTNFTFAITNTVATNGNANASLVQTNGIETLTISLDNLLAFTAVSTNDSFFQLQGQLVASRMLPLPAVNNPPVLSPSTNLNVIAGHGIGISLFPVDPDPGQVVTLAYTGLPVTVTSNGFTWTTTLADAFTQQTVHIIATDNGLPPLSATQTITFVIAGFPTVTNIVPAATSRDIGFPSMPGFDYNLEASPQLGSNEVWSVVNSVTTTNMIGLVSDVSPCTSNQFYRVQFR